MVPAITMLGGRRTVVSSLIGMHIGGESGLITGVSTFCALADDAMAVIAKVMVAQAMAGECGNRTHPTRLGRVTPVLKTGEATRPHPPPRVLFNHDRNCLSLDDFAYLRSARHARKIVSGPLLRHRDEKPTRRLRIAQQIAHYVGRRPPVD
jgi:hypothetical protein